MEIINENTKYPITVNGRVVASLNVKRLKLDRKKIILPNMNKRCTLAEYVAELNSNYVQKIEIEITDIILMSSVEFNDFAENTMKRYDFLEGKGGVDSDSKFKFQEFNMPENEEADWIRKSYRIGVKIVDIENEKIIYVDPQGFDYARWIGFAA